MSEELRGEVLEVKSTRYSVDVKLDTGVSVSFSFNPGYIAVFFSGYDYQKCITIGELNLRGIEHNLGNTFSIQYHLNPDSVRLFDKKLAKPFHQELRKQGT